MPRKLSVIRPPSALLRLTAPLAVFVLASAPLAVFAKPLIPCGETGNECHLDDVFIFINNVIEFLITLIVPVAVLGFVYIGFGMITSDAPAKYNELKGYAQNLAIGMLLIFGAWVVVKLAFSLFLSDQYPLINILGN